MAGLQTVGSQLDSTYVVIVEDITNIGRLEAQLSKQYIKNEEQQVLVLFTKRDLYDVCHYCEMLCYFIIFCRIKKQTKIIRALKTSNNRKPYRVQGRKSGKQYFSRQWVMCNRQSAIHDGVDQKIKLKLALIKSMTDTEPMHYCIHCLS